jgi:hypothetical protein
MKMSGKTFMLEDWKISAEAQKSLPGGVVFPMLTSDSDKDIAIWMDIVESICASKDCLSTLLNGVFLDEELDDEDRPEVGDPKRMSWTRWRNSIKISNKISLLKSLVLLAELKRTLSGTAKTYAGFRADSSPQVVWSNLKMALRKTITQSSDFSQGQWKDLRLEDFPSVKEFTSAFLSALDTLEIIRSDIGESKLKEVDKINTFMNAIKDSNYNAHRIAWMQNSKPEEAKLQFYIDGLEKDAATYLANSKEKGLVMNHYKEHTKSTDSSKGKPVLGKRKSYPDKERKYNDNEHHGPAKSKNSTNEKFPNRSKDTKAIDYEKKKLGNQVKSSNSSKKYCDHCKGKHNISACWTLYPHLRPSKEKGNLLKGNIEMDLSDDERIPYKYDDDERAICLSLRDIGNDKNDEVKSSSRDLAGNNEVANLANHVIEHERCFMARTKIVKST